jgi:hypothetical protein
MAGEKEGPDSSYFHCYHDAMNKNENRMDYVLCNIAKKKKKCISDVVFLLVGGLKGCAQKLNE